MLVASDDRSSAKADQVSVCRPGLDNVLDFVAVDLANNGRITANVSLD